jgi:hypothetical protein
MNGAPSVSRRWPAWRAAAKSSAARVIGRSATNEGKRGGTETTLARGAATSVTISVTARLVRSATPQERCQPPFSPRWRA